MPSTVWAMKTCQPHPGCSSNLFIWPWPITIFKIRFNCGTVSEVRQTGKLHAITQDAGTVGIGGKTMQVFLHYCPSMWGSLDDNVGLQQRLQKNGCGFLSYSAPPNCSTISSLLCIHPGTKGYWINNMSSSWTESLAQALAELSSLVIQQSCGMISGVISEGSTAGTHFIPVMSHPPSGMSHSLSSLHQVMRRRY